MGGRLCFQNPRLPITETARLAKGAHRRDAAMGPQWHPRRFFGACCPVLPPLEGVGGLRPLHGRSRGTTAGVVWREGGIWNHQEASMAPAHARPLTLQGNWKMNGLAAPPAELDAIAEAPAAGRRRPRGGADLPACHPDRRLRHAPGRQRRPRIGGQDYHAKPSGALTGDIAAEMLARCRREPWSSSAIPSGATDHGETDDVVKAKAEAALRAGLVAIVCIGETRAEREAGETLARGRQQLAGSLPAGATAANTVIAYEPVWAIGTGLTPTAGDDRGSAQFHPRPAPRALTSKARTACASSTAARSSRPMRPS